MTADSKTVSVNLSGTDILVNRYAANDTACSVIRTGNHSIATVNINVNACNMVSTVPIHGIYVTYAQSTNITMKNSTLSRISGDWTHDTRVVRASGNASIVNLTL